MFHEVSQGGMDCRFRYQVNVVQYQQPTLREFYKSIDERSEQILDGRRLLGVQVGHELRTHPRLQTIQGCEHVLPEAYQVIILLIERDPGYLGSLFR